MRSVGRTVVVADTEAHARFFREEFGLAEERVEVCFVGAEDRLFFPGWQPEAPFHALFVGKLIPLHGLETILAAAALAPEIPFRVVGSGQLEPLLDDRPAERRVAAVGRLRRPAGRDPGGRLRARHLRDDGEGRAGDPEQGLPGARLRHAARHRRHAGRARAARPTAATRCSFRPATRRRWRAPYVVSPAIARWPTRIGAAGRATYEAHASEAVLGARWRALLERAIAPRDPAARPALVAVAAFAAGMSALAVLQQRAFETGRFDVGNLTQAVWSTAHGRFLEVTDLQGTRSRASEPIRPARGPARAALVALAEP